MGYLVDQRISDHATYQAVDSSGSNNGTIPGTRISGQLPGSNLEIDYTEIKPGTYRYSYLLVFIDTFSGWVEAYLKKDLRWPITEGGGMRQADSTGSSGD